MEKNGQKEKLAEFTVLDYYGKEFVKFENFINNSEELKNFRSKQDARPLLRRDGEDRSSVDDFVGYFEGLIAKYNEAFDIISEKNKGLTKVQAAQQKSIINRLGEIVKEVKKISFEPLDPSKI